MMAAPFVPLSDLDFKGFVASHSAIPIRRGNSLFVAKWIDGPGMDADLFLADLRSTGASLEVRDFKGDVNIRVVPGPTKAPVGMTYRPRHELTPRSH
jgi:hypothetical protein